QEPSSSLDSRSIGSRYLDHRARSEPLLTSLGSTRPDWPHALFESKDISCHSPSHFPNQPTPPAPLAHLLASSAPLGLEYSLAVSYIDELESQIGLLDETIASLQLRRADLLQSVKVHRAALSPIRRLPPEILGEIFSLVVRATFHSYTVEQTPLTQHAPWLFTRVCRYWSAVALSNSALWSMILRDHDCTEENPGALPLTKLCLERSGNVPLNVTIFQEMGVSDLDLVVFDTVLASSAQWGRVKLDVLSGFSCTYALLQQLTS
ncbi:hypothetical protein B0H14DRAFT_1622309, partial [Mycena olivaceomarginata]